MPEILQFADILRRFIIVTLAGLMQCHFLTFDRVKHRCTVRSGYLEFLMRDLFCSSTSISLRFMITHLWRNVPINLANEIRLVRVHLDDRLLPFVLLSDIEQAGVL